MRRGFTMVEMLLSIMILAIMTIISTMVFHTVVRNWTLATEMADNMQRVDYITAQVAYALRSAYFPTSGQASNADGFMLLDENERNEPESSDVITWTKLGQSIVGRNSRFAHSPHRVTLFVRSEKDADEEHPAGLIAQVIGEDKFRPDDFDEDDESNWDWFLLGSQVQGFNCRVLDKDEPFKSGMANWQDTWDTSNCIPRRVQLTFWMKPIDEDKDPYPIVRVLDIPLWDISQNPLKTDSTASDGGKNKKTSGSKSSSGGSGGSGGKSGSGGSGGSGGRSGSGGSGGSGGRSGSGGADGRPRVHRAGAGGGMPGGGMSGGGAPPGGGMIR